MKEIIPPTTPEIKPGVFSKAARAEMYRVLEQIDVIVNNKIKPGYNK